MRLVKKIRLWWKGVLERRAILWTIQSVPGIGFDGVMRLAGDGPDRKGLRDNIDTMIRNRSIFKDHEGHYWPAGKSQ